MVSTTTLEIIHQALETVSTKQVLAWCKESLDDRFSPSAEKCLAALGGSEQKRTPLAEGP